MNGRNSPKILVSEERVTTRATIGLEDVILAEFVCFHLIHLPGGSYHGGDSDLCCCVPC